MAGQDLTVNVKTTSDVPQAMDRAKSATVSFGKQVEDIQKKFSTAFKDVFLSFLGPMALLGVALNYIGKLIEENQRKHADANQAAIDGTNELISAEEQYWARKMAREKKSKEDVEQAKMSREDITKSFLLNDPRGKAIIEAETDPSGSRPKFLNRLRNYAEEAGVLSKSSRVQDMIRQIIADDLAKNGMIAKPGQEGKPTSSYAAPQGVNAIVGMGNNAAMDALNAQLEENRKQTMLLEQIANSGSYTPPDFTKPTSAAPSRSAYLKK